MKEKNVDKRNNKNKIRKCWVKCEIIDWNKNQTRKKNEDNCE